MDAEKTLPHILGTDEADTLEVPVLSPKELLRQEQKTVDESLLVADIFETLNVPEAKRSLVNKYVESGAWLKYAPKVEVHSHIAQQKVAAIANIDIKMDLWQIFESMNQATIADLGSEIDPSGVNASDRSRKLAALVQSEPRDSNEDQDRFWSAAELAALKQTYLDKAGVTGTEISVTFGLDLKKLKENFNSTNSDTSGDGDAVSGRDILKQAQENPNLLLAQLTAQPDHADSLQYRYRKAKHMICMFHGWNADTWVTRYDDDEYGKVDIPGYLLKDLPPESCFITFPRLGTRQEYPIEKDRYNSKDDAAMTFLTLRMIGGYRAREIGPQTETEAKSPPRTLEAIGHSMGGAMVLYFDQLAAKFNSKDRAVILSLNPAYRQRVQETDAGVLEEVVADPNVWARVGPDGRLALAQFLTQLPLAEVYSVINKIPVARDLWTNTNRIVARFAMMVSFGKFHKHYSERHAEAYASSPETQVAARKLAKDAPNQPGISEWDHLEHGTNAIVATTATDTLVRWEALEANLPDQGKTLTGTGGYLPIVVLPGGDHYSFFEPEQLRLQDTMLKLLRLPDQTFLKYKQYVQALKTKEVRAALAAQQQQRLSGSKPETTTESDPQSESVTEIEIEIEIDYDWLVIDYLKGFVAEKEGSETNKLETLVKILNPELNQQDQTEESRGKVEQLTQLARNYLRLRIKSLEDVMENAERAQGFLGRAIYGSSENDIVKGYSGFNDRPLDTNEETTLLQLETLLRGLHIVAPFVL